MRSLIAAVTDYLHTLTRTASESWDRFWFTPADPATLSLIRIATGLMLLYAHAVWTLDLDAFFGPHAWMDAGAIAALRSESYTWSYLWFCQSPPALWTVHLLTGLVFLMFTAGIRTRITSLASAVLLLGYLHRTPLALFGLDQILCFLTLYLAVGPSGAEFSWDAWRRRKNAGSTAAPSSVSANIAVRLVQMHLCILYLFAGLSKLQGVAWWDGTAIWGAMANLEYQSLDMTWLAHWPLLVNILTQVTVAWELSYCVLIWSPLSRPLILLLAIPLHLGIALCLGMSTFGLIMLVANMAFISPRLIRTLVGAQDQPAETTVATDLSQVSARAA